MYYEYDLKQRINSLETFRESREHFEGLGFEYLDLSEKTLEGDEWEENWLIDGEIQNYIVHFFLEDGYSILACDSDFWDGENNRQFNKRILIAKISEETKKELLYYECLAEVSISSSFSLTLHSTNRGFLLNEKSKGKIMFEDKEEAQKEYDKRLKVLLPKMSKKLKNLQEEGWE